MYIGYHVSSRGGLVPAWERASKLGSNTFQVFSSPPRNWSLPKLDPARVEREFQEIAALGGGRIVFHAPYVVNLASPSSDLRRRSIDAVVYGMKLSGLTGGAPLVVHAGSATDGDRDGALKRLSASLKAVGRRAPAAGRLVFELTAGAGVALAALPQDLPRLLESAAVLEDVGICIDTQHLWAAGFDWHRDRAGRRLIEEMTRLGCLDSLCCIHLNDSKSPRGSHLDRHANLGDGLIGLGPLVELVTDATVPEVPVILETPGSDEVRSREFRRLVQESRSGSRSPRARRGARALRRGRGGPPS